ncbi:MAG: type IV toxin-antitoxin system AbiEi family antitoxin [Alphaproteobacteria bacterium]|nr:type IV toxin-antitoxin system AbiEi family antitoxin [Alphaproteobacteria bacterium]
MKSDSRIQIRDYIAGLMQAGRYLFSSVEAATALGASADAVKLALNRLRRKGEIASPGRGVYVIVPPEYRSLGCLPADQFIPALMAHAKAPYYAGLLTAAQYHGAAHHRPQEFQVMVEKARRPIECGLVRIAFHVRKRLSEVPTQNINTPRGFLAVSTPVATAFDLVGYETQVGGLDAIATVLIDLAERLEPQELAALAPSVPLPWVQRLGYLLELIDEAPRAQHLKDFVSARARDVVSLQPSVSRDGATRSREWKLFINADIETDT